MLLNPSCNLFECHADIQPSLDLLPIFACQMLATLLVACHYADLLSGILPKLRATAKIHQSKIHSFFRYVTCTENEKNMKKKNIKIIDFL